MINDSETINRVLSKIEETELVHLAEDIIGIHSPTGKEKELGEYILSWFSSNGFQTVRQDVEPDRLNAVGILKGKGMGLSLMFNGHMDTSFSGTEADLSLIRKMRPEFEPRAFIKDGKICGLGAGNMKGSLASVMIAGNAIRQSGVVLKGDLILAAVAGEVSVAPVDEYQGSSYHGEGFGTRYLLSHGIQSDYAVVADGSALSVTNTQAGVVYLKVTTFGETFYTPFTERAENRLESRNAVVKMLPIIEAIEDWAARYERDNKYEFQGGMVIPKVSIGAIRGGLPYRPSRSAGECKLYLDVRTPPSSDPLKVKAEVEGVVKSLGAETMVTVYRSQKGYEGKGTLGLLQTVKEAHEYLFGTPPPPVRPPVASMWTDTNIYNEMGIPAVKCGPSCIQPEDWGSLVTNEIEIEELMKAARLFSLIALEICNRESCFEE